MRTRDSDQGCAVSVGWGCGSSSRREFLSALTPHMKSVCHFSGRIQAHKTTLQTLVFQSPTLTSGHHNPGAGSVAKQGLLSG